MGQYFVKSEKKLGVKLFEGVSHKRMNFFCFLKNKMRERSEGIYAILILAGVILMVVLMYYRAFFGTELTDEAYYVSEAKEMLNGNIPFAYNNSSKALGFTFLLIAIESVYKLFVPDLAGVFLFTRLCFVTYKVIVCCVVYRVLQRRGKKSHALLLTGMLLPLNGTLQNFSYNTVPIYTMFLSGCLLYDVLELDAPCKKVKLIIAGTMTGIGCFANPGWAIMLIIFSILILRRTSEKKEKIISTAIFGVAIFGVALIVVILISVQTSISELWYGFYRLFINPIPMDPLNPSKTWGEVIESFRSAFKIWVKIFFVTFTFTLAFSTRYVYEGGIKLTKKQCLVLSVTIGMFYNLLSLIYTVRDLDTQSQLAFSAFCYMIVFAILGVYKDEKIIWYLGISPPAFSIAQIILLSNGADIGRFVNAFTILIPMLYVLLKSKVELVRIASTIITVALIVFLGYVDFKFVYRDGNFHSLNYKVESGVYKGLYTTEARARDLPEMEKYLNSIIMENDTYAFRDNVPSAYLMVHKGKMCEISTWDILQYSYKRNSPAVMFDYYRRRDMIPNKIIYVDYGRDENLSIFEPDYKYNDWVNTYYDLVEDIELNETFFRIMVYQYNGTFDGNYQYWIDNY